MGEPESIKAIKDGYTIIDNTKYTIVKSSSGSCDNCIFSQKLDCSDIARHICCTGGYIFKK